MTEAQLIILEGPDRVGKSSIASLLKGNLNDPVILKYSGTLKVGQEGHDHQEQVFRQSFMDAMELMDEGRTVIMDRSYVGEYVYSRYFGRPEPRYLGDLHKEFQRLDPLYVFVNGPACGFLNGTDIYLEPHRKEIAGRFLSFFATNLPCRFIGVDNRNFEGQMERDKWVLDSVLDRQDDPLLNEGTVWRPDIPFLAEEPEKHPFWGHQEAVSAYHAAPVVGIGPPEFQYSVFGEAPGERGAGLTHIPFYHDKSGQLLRKAFGSAGYSLDLMYVSNVFHNTPYNNELYGFVKKEDLAAVDFTDLSKLEPWMRYEMKMFRDEAVYTSKSKKVFAVGRTAELMLNLINQQLGLKMDVIHMKHPASFLYGHRTEAEAVEYYRRLLAQ